MKESFKYFTGSENVCAIGAIIDNNQNAYTDYYARMHRKWPSKLEKKEHLMLSQKRKTYAERGKTRSLSQASFSRTALGFIALVVSIITIATASAETSTLKFDNLPVGKIKELHQIHIDCPQNENLKVEIIAPADSHGKSLHIYDRSMSGRASLSWDLTKPLTKAFYLECQLQPRGREGADYFFLRLDQDAKAPSICFYKGKVHFQEKVIGTYQLGIWYTLKVNGDASTGTFSVWVVDNKNKVVASANNVYSPLENKTFKHLQVATLGSVFGEVCIDKIQVESDFQIDPICEKQAFKNKTAFPILEIPFEARFPQPTLPLPQSSINKEGIQRCGSDWKLALGRVHFILDGHSGALTSARGDSGKELLLSPGGLFYQTWPENNTTSPSDGKAINFKLAKNILSFDWESSSVTVRHELQIKSPTYLRWNATFHNRTKKRLLLELRLALPFAWQTDSYYWDGALNRKIDGKRMQAILHEPDFSNYVNRGLFPLATVYGNKDAFAVGIDSRDIYSYFGSACNPDKKDSGRFHYLVRIVLEPQESKSCRFILGSYRPDWGWRQAVASYYSSFPKLYEARDCDDMWGFYTSAEVSRQLGSGKIGGTAVLKDRVIDLFRRGRSGVIEFMFPYDGQRSGDFYPENEPAFRTPNGSDTANRAQVAAAMDTLNVAGLNLSYLIPDCCDAKLAEDKYSDAIMKLSNGKRSYQMFHMLKWLRMYPAPANQYGKDIMADIEKIVKNYRPEGFYFDYGCEIFQDFGRVNQYSAYTNQGQIYAVVGSGLSQIWEWLRTSFPDLIILSGEKAQYFGATRVDMQLANQTVPGFYDTWNIPVSLYLRMNRVLYGRKPVYMGEPGFWYFGKMNKAKRAAFFPCLEFGSFPFYMVLPDLRHAMLQKIEHNHKADTNAFFAQSQFLMEWFQAAKVYYPVLKELAVAGWRPVTHAICTPSDNVKLERFGEGQSRLLFSIINNHLQTRNAEFVVDTEALGLKAIPVLGDFNAWDKFHTTYHKKSGLLKAAFTLPAADAFVLKAWGFLKLPEDTPENLVIESAVQLSPEDRSELEISLKSASQIYAELKIIPPNELRVDSVKINQKDAEVSADGVVKLKIYEKDTTVRVKLISIYDYLPSRREVLRVDFLKTAEPVSIVISKNGGKAAENVARRIRSFILLQAELVGKKTEVEIVQGYELTRKYQSQIIVGFFTNPQLQKILHKFNLKNTKEDCKGIIATITDNKLLVAGPEEKSLTDCLNNYFDKIEAPYAGIFGLGAPVNCQ